MPSVDSPRHRMREPPERACVRGGGPGYPGLLWNREALSRRAWAARCQGRAPATPRPRLVVGRLGVPDARVRAAPPGDPDRPAGPRTLTVTGPAVHDRGHGGRARGHARLARRPKRARARTLARRLRRARARAPRARPRALTHAGQRLRAAVAGGAT